ncbi:hypothetical protein [Hymenobacter sp. GOD-10R]|uniref:hypothetical protein n=1 Tax=Hymenobacter sp. GOD-10R TaxID=3093922 RepID=UPI002D79B846|nr:hypothetical protein [Hymenobacter sp. GOD-10R]WRQ30692.1 hypothetical protein SD425_10510 [Hymenobacter sp. GOD-10R]
MITPLRQPLRVLWIGLLLLVGSFSLHAQTYYPVAGNEQPVALLQRKKDTYLVTQQSVFRLEHKQFVRKYQSAAPIQCAVNTDTVLWLGTRQGAIRLNTRQFSAHAQHLPTTEAEPNITTLFQDATGAVWLGAAGEGMFRYAQGDLQRELSIPSVNTGLTTADSSVWIGTNIGLYRWHRHQWTRYNEEGVANHEIPDNIVEKLLRDNGGTMWVLMSAGISVFSGDAQRTADTEHLLTVTFIGQPGNEVYSVAYLNGVGHVFATAMGLLLLPAESSSRLEKVESATDQIIPKQLLVPLSLPASTAAKTHGPRLTQVDEQQRVWMTQAGQVSVWTAKAFRRMALHSPTTTSPTVGQ